MGNVSQSGRLEALSHPNPFAEGEELKVARNLHPFISSARA